MLACWAVPPSTTTAGSGPGPKNQLAGLQFPRTFGTRVTRPTVQHKKSSPTTQADCCPAIADDKTKMQTRRRTDVLHELARCMDGARTGAALFSVSLPHPALTPRSWPPFRAARGNTQHTTPLACEVKKQPVASVCWSAHIIDIHMEDIDTHN